ncbi:MAG: F0F1 ATP synthase subunit A [candidate division WOR-3 bacterium]|nr:F0F1 ATP synthase subunit A [candidate division WOR-3 bacterium]
MKGLHISIAAEELFRIGSFPVTNSLLVTYLVILFFILVIFLVKRNIIPRGIQNVVEYILEYFYNLICDVFGSEEKGKKFFPLIVTIFLFVLSINWFGLLPGVGTIGFYREKPVHIEQIEHKESGGESHHQEQKGHKEFIPLLRGASADLNTTLALALISVIFTQIYSIQALGFKGFLKRFIKLKNPIMFFVGILELIAEIAKIISFSFRLFGNIFAGEVLLTVMLVLLPILIPAPFLALEIFVGVIQAIIFSFLTLFFIKIATTEEEH